MNPSLIMLAGPNGAGKTTFYNTFLHDKGLMFVNADILAKQFKLGAYEAASLATEIRENLLEDQRSFITETVFSDPVGEKLAFLETAVAQGYDVTLIYIGISDTALSSKRVQIRVAAGGHDVPLEKLEARYVRSLHNLKLSLAKLPMVVVYENSDPTNPYVRLLEFRAGQLHNSYQENLPSWLTAIIPE